MQDSIAARGLSPFGPLDSRLKPVGMTRRNVLNCGIQVQ